MKSLSQNDLNKDAKEVWHKGLRHPRQRNVSRMIDDENHKMKEDMEGESHE